MNSITPHIICFGEVLWDLLPSGKIAGGAPMNVAYHARKLGLSAQMVSKVGTDKLGKELLTFLNEKGVVTDLIQKDYTFNTGTVKVTLDEKGSPSYEIVEDVAWDYIHLNNANKMATEQADALVFGSLSARKQTSKSTLFQLLELAKFKVFDVNLRPPFYDKKLLQDLLAKADLVKMNDEELDIIGEWYSSEKEEVPKAQAVLNACNLKTLIVTKGPDGAFAVDKNNVFRERAMSIKVKDTIGSGDSFLAGFLSQYLHEKPITDCLNFAGKIGALVATKQGGTPNYSKKEIEEIGIF